MSVQLALLETYCCKHCARNADGTCRWLTEKHMAAHISTCFECGPRRDAR